MNNIEVKRGEIYYTDLTDASGMEENGVRPCIILQNNVGNKMSRTTIIAPISSRFEHSGIPTHIPVPEGSGGLTKPSIVMLEQIRVIDKKRLYDKLGMLNPYIMGEIDRALKISVGLNEKYNKLRK